MPKRYEKMRDEFKKQGMEDKKAKEKAAKIYNATRKNSPPVSGKERKSDMMKKKPTTRYKKGGSVKTFKPCASCPSPAKCKKAGKCMKKGK